MSARNETSAPLEIRIAGFGGQGVILAGMVLGRALVLYEGREVSLTQSFGPEARGSACSVQLMVAREPILYPYVVRPHILVALSQEAYRKFEPGLREGGTLIVEEDLVQRAAAEEFVGRGIHVFGVPATRLAEELGRKMVFNMVVLGFFTAVTGLLEAENARRALTEAVPKGTAALNLAAFDKGYAFAMSEQEVGATNKR